MELLRKLVTTYGPSGHEDDVADIIIDEIKTYADDIKRDSLGNVIALKKGTGLGRVMTTAHMDQIGCMITNIDKNGYLRFIGVGYVDPYVAFSQTIIFKNGTIGTIWREEKKDIKNLKISDLYIDIGAASISEAMDKVNIGDFGVFGSGFSINGERITSGALDDRIGCFILIEAIKKIKNPVCDVYFVFTVQEETYISGAVTSAYAIEPDSAIVVDVTDTGDTPECLAMTVKMEGCTVKVMDRGLICHPKIKNFLIDTARANNIKYQLEVLEAGTTDGSAIHKTKTGVLTGVISIPSRYIHSPREMVDKRDVNGAIELLTKALENYKNL